MVSLGGSWQDQSGSFNNQGSSSGSSSTMPTLPQGYEDAWNRFKPGEGNPATDTINDAIGSLDQTGQYFSNQMNRDSHTLAGLSQKYPGMYSELTPVQAQQISASQGSDYMGDYENKYTDDVLDSSLADYDYGVGGAANAFRLGDLGAGGGGSRSTVAAAEMAGQAARGRGALSSGIRSNAFNTAAGLGMQDANRFLTADATNASNSLAAQQFNNQMQNQRQMFDVNAAYRGDALRDQSALNFGNNAINQANLGNLGFSQGINWLGAGNPMIGQTNEFNETNNQSGTSQQSGSGKSAGVGK